MADQQERVGQTVGDYRLLRWLGGGGFGNVYLAEHLHHQIQIAVKILTTRLTNADDWRAFVNEARMFRLRHPHIMPLLDFGISRQEEPFLVMDYAPNGTLRSRHPKGSRVPLPLIVHYVTQVGSALQYAHEQRLIHRDVKPENMLLRSDDLVLLSDFGISTAAHSTHSFTANAGISGTVPYMAPEQLDGKPYPQSDQYALAVVIYEWLTGHCPFVGTTVEVVVQHATKPPPSLRAQVPGLPAEVEGVLFCALAKDPRERFVSMDAFVSALRQVSAVPSLGQAMPGGAMDALSRSQSPLSATVRPSPLNGSTVNAEMGPSPSSQFPPNMGAGAPSWGQFPPNMGSGVPPSGQFPPNTGAGLPSWGQFPPNAGAGAPPSGQFPPNAGAGAPPSGQFPPNAGVGAPPSGQFPPNAGVGLPPSSQFVPNAGVGSPSLMPPSQDRSFDGSPFQAPGGTEQAVWHAAPSQANALNNVPQRTPLERLSPPTISAGVMPPPPISLDGTVPSFEGFSRPAVVQNGTNNKVLSPQPNRRRRKMVMALAGGLLAVLGGSGAVVAFAKILCLLWSDQLRWCLYGPQDQFAQLWKLWSCLCCR